MIFVQGGDPVIYPDPDASIPEPSVVYMTSMRRLKTMDTNTTGGLLHEPHEYMIKVSK